MPETQEAPVKATMTDSQILSEAKARLKFCRDNDHHNRENADKVLKFLLGDGYSQWDANEVARREADKRIVLQINQLTKYAKQVIGDMRQNKVRVKVHPESSDADPETAKIREGIIGDVEYQSNAESIYDYARAYNAKCGYGAWRVRTRYTKENPFEQEPYLELIENPLNVYMDPSAKDPNYADAKYGFVIDQYTRKEFKEEFGELALTETLNTNPSEDSADYLWWGTDFILVVEYFRVETMKVNKVLLSDGQIMTKKQADEYLAGWEASPNKSTTIPTIQKEREVEEKEVKWYKLKGDAIIQRGDWPGPIIPIVLFHGEKINIGGKTHIYGMFHDALDAQRNLNYWYTALAEAVALQPKAPIVITPKEIAGFEKDYAQAHDKNTPFLLFNPDPSAPGRPGRMDSAGVNPALFAQVEKAEQNLKDTMGMYNADVGDTGNEISGVAIRERQTPGDTATFIYHDNGNQAIAHSGRIINSIIPFLYDTERDARLKKDDETEAFVPINTTVQKATNALEKDPSKYGGLDKKKLGDMMASPDAGPFAPYNDVKAGSYSVIISTGPSFATRRMEASAHMLQMAVALPNMNPLDKYFFIDKQDFDGAHDWAEAIRRTLPPGTMELRPGEEPPPPPPPDPKIGIEMAKMEVQKLDKIVQIERAQTERIKQRTALIDMLTKLKEADAQGRQEVLGMLAQLKQEYDQGQADQAELQQPRQQMPQPQMGMQ